jgi:hypothetical protein
MMSEYYYILENPDIDHYARIKAENMSLVDFATQGMYGSMDNLQTKYLSGRKNPAYGVYSADLLEIVKENLRKYFVVVGITEQFDESLIFMKRTLGWRTPYYVRENVTRHRPGKDSLKPEEVRVIQDISRMDCELYDWARQRFTQQIEAQGEDFADDVRAFKLLNRQYATFRYSLPTAVGSEHFEIALIFHTLNALLAEKKFADIDVVLRYAENTYPTSADVQKVSHMLKLQLDYMSRLPELRQDRDPRESEFDRQLIRKNI